MSFLETPPPHLLRLMPIFLRLVSILPSEEGQSHNTRTEQQPGGGFGDGCPIQRKGCIECGWCPTSHNVHAHAQPVGIEQVIPGPCLQVSHTGGKWRRPSATDWPRCRQPVELSAVSERHLRDKEIMIGRQVERRSEGQI